jgi:hypothetical protein
LQAFLQVPKHIKFFLSPQASSLSRGKNLPQTLKTHFSSFKAQLKCHPLRKTIFPEITLVGMQVSPIKNILFPSLPPAKTCSFKFFLTYLIMCTSLSRKLQGHKSYLYLAPRGTCSFPAPPLQCLALPGHSKVLARMWEWIKAPYPAMPLLT